MNMVELIETKRDGGILDDRQIAWLIDGYTRGTIPDYQMAAMAMAIYQRGLDPRELAAWTTAMLHSGEVLDFPEVGLPKVDKHSTGGVGDKVSIPLAPMVAACGVAVPMMSGRGLGHTGGTLDKLESITGFRTGLDPTEFRRILHQTGLVLAGQSETLVPADRKLYALRDATGTVASIPLIASSIMSKKLAEGLDALVLDVKFGSGAFMQDPDEARLLAQTMVEIGRRHQVATVALLTDMDTPLGREVGNANEVAESLAVLRGEGPADLTEITFALGAEMLMVGGVCRSIETARSALEASIHDGRALGIFRRVVELQGGDIDLVDDPERLPRAPHTHQIRADGSGYVARCDARQIGVAAMRLGAGREHKDDTIDPGVGVTLVRKPGESVRSGEVLATIHYRHPARLEEALRVLDGAWTVTVEPPPERPLIRDRIE